MAKRNPSKNTVVAAAAVPADPTEGMNGAQKVAWYSLLATVLLVPIAMSNVTWLGFDLPFTYDQFDIVKVFTMRALLMVTLLAWSWDLLIRGGKIRTTPLEWVILAFLVWVAVTSVTSIHPPTAVFGKYRRFEGLLSFVTYAVGYFMVLQYADRPSRVRAIGQMFFWSSLIVSGYGVAQSLGLDPINWQKLPFEANRAFSTYGNPDLLGGFLVIALPILFALPLTEKRLRWRALYWFGFLMTVWCWIVAFTRGAWIGGAVGMSIVLVWAVVLLRRKVVELGAVDYSFAAATTVVGATVVVRSLSNPNAVMNVWLRLASIFETGQGSALTRFQIWEAAWNAVRDRPIFGFGADTFRLVFPKYKVLEYVEAAGYLSVADNVHNYYLQLATGIGIVGAVIFLGMVIYAAVRSAKVVFRSDKGLAGLLLVGFWAACAGYLVHLFFGLSVTGSTLLFWIAMGVVIAPTARARTFTPPSWGVWVAAGLLALVLVLQVLNVVYVVADNAHMKARLLSGQARIDNARRAIALNPFNDMYRAELGLALMDDGFSAALLQLQQQGGSGENAAILQQQVLQFYEETERVMLQTIDFVPWEYDNYVFLSALYNQAAQVFGDRTILEKALATAERGIDVEPFGPAIRVQKARALAGLGRLDEAIKELRTAYGMDHKYTEAALFLATLLQEQGKTDEALELLKAHEARVPGQAGVSQMIEQLEASAAAGK